MFPDLLRDDAFRLETSRLWLRWPRIADAVAIAKLAGSKAVSQYTERLPHPYTDGDAEAFILACRKENTIGRDFGLALTRKGKPSEVIGMIGAHARIRDEIALGFWLGEPFWGQGFMGEALDEMVALVFSVTCPEALTAMVRTENVRSRNLLASRGFELAEDRLVNMLLRGGIFPCVKLRLGREDWQRLEQDRFRRMARPPQPREGRNDRGNAELKLSA